jgi:hypothetical protein
LNIPLENPFHTSHKRLITIFSEASGLKAVTFLKKNGTTYRAIL